MTVAREREIDKVARAMARRNGSTLDAMRVSVANKWRYLAETAIDTLDELRASNKA